jgi:hypothetical protein
VVSRAPGRLGWAKREQCSAMAMCWCSGYAWWTGARSNPVGACPGGTIASSLPYLCVHLAIWGHQLQRLSTQQKKPWKATRSPSGAGGFSAGCGVFGNTHTHAAHAPTPPARPALPAMPGCARDTPPSRRADRQRLRRGPRPPLLLPGQACLRAQHPGLPHRRVLAGARLRGPGLRGGPDAVQAAPSSSSSSSSSSRSRSPQLGRSAATHPQPAL